MREKLMHAAGRALSYAWGLVRAPLYWLAYLAGGLVPRDPDLWVFGSWNGRKLADNPKWLFLRIAGEATSPRCVWISRDPEIVREVRRLGHEAFGRRSPRGLWLSLRAGHYIFDHSTDDIGHVTSRRARRVLLFHGIPLKKLRRDIETPGNFNHRVFRGGGGYRALVTATRPAVTESYDVITATSPAIRDIYGSAFGVDTAAVPVTGFPRNDVLLDPDRLLPPTDRAARDRLAGLRSNGARVAFYMPTWRDYRDAREPDIDWVRLDAFLRDRDAVLAVKRHSRAAPIATGGHRLERIVEVDHAADPYPLLRLADVLVTDYSSVAFDYMLLRRPIVYYCYDLDEYLRRSRSFYFEYDAVTPGAKAGDFPALLEALDRALEEGGEAYMREWAGRYDATMELCHAYTDARSAERVVEALRG